LDSVGGSGPMARRTCKPLEPARKCVRGKSFTQHISLDHIAAHVPQGVQGGFVLHALRDTTKVEGVREIDRRLHEPSITWRLIQVAYESAIGLELVQWQLTQIRERRIAGAEIVERELDAQLLQPMQTRGRLCEAVNHRAFDDL